MFGTVEAVFSMAEYFVLVLLCPTIAGLVLSVLDTPPTYPRVLRSVSLSLPSSSCSLQCLDGVTVRVFERGSGYRIRRRVAVGANTRLHHHKVGWLHMRALSVES